jgi:oligopeptide/dipeptide ABC transporter ATP-binding protein
VVTPCSVLPSSDDATRKLRSGSREPLLRVEGLSVEFPVEQGLHLRAAAQPRALDAVDLRVRRGQIVAVVGEAGAGKTTLARSIVGLVPASTGKLRFEGKDLAGLGESELRACLAQIRTVTSEALTVPGALAALMAAGTKLLVFDGAFDAFDAATRLRLFMEIRGLQDEQAFTALVLTRSLEVAGALSDQILVLHAGQIVESGATASLLSHPQHPYTRGLLSPKAVAASSPPLGVDEPKSLSRGCRFRARCPQAFERCAEQTPSLFAVPGGLSRCFLNDPGSPAR